jgi:hypothetical protein
MWRWMIIFISLHPPTSEQHKTISGRSPNNARVTVVRGPEIVFRPLHQIISANFGTSLANFTKTSMQHSHEDKNKELLKKYSSAPFGKCCKNSATNSSGQFYFSPVPCELFGRNSATWQH